MVHSSENQETQQEDMQHRELDIHQVDQAAHQAEDSTDVLVAESLDSIENRNQDKEGAEASFALFKQTFESAQEIEKKLELAVAFMESTLSQSGSPHFRLFWEVRKLSLPLFKEAIAPGMRSHLWSRHSELSKEARRLKEILDEQSAFAVEQIEIAIQALEKELEHISKLGAAEAEKSLENTPVVDSSLFPAALKEKKAHYQEIQQQLQLLNVAAARINGLRKELLKNEMRVRFKNKFFQRLSQAGDLVFPKRKELIKQLSESFTKDVAHFIQENGAASHSSEVSAKLKEEIKSFQNLAKLLTLNTQSFNQTRLQLSEFWDRLKLEEKERKKEWVQKKILFQENAVEVENRIQALKEAFEKKEKGTKEVEETLEAISVYMRSVDLGREDVKKLKEQLQEIRKGVQDVLRAQEDQRKALQTEHLRQKREKYEALKSLGEKLLQCEMDLEEMMASQNDFLSQVHAASFLTKAERFEMDKIVKRLRDVIAEKREQAFLVLSDDDKLMMEQLQHILNEKKERRMEIRAQIESLRKEKGSSSLDFEKAMQATAQMNEERERLEKINASIEETEKKIADLRAKLT